MVCMVCISECPSKSSITKRMSTKVMYDRSVQIVRMVWQGQSLTWTSAMIYYTCIEGIKNRLIW